MNILQRYSSDVNGTSLTARGMVLFLFAGKSSLPVSNHSSTNMGVIPFSGLDY